MLLIMSYHGNQKDYPMKVLNHLQYLIIDSIQDQIIMVQKQGSNLLEVV